MERRDHHTETEELFDKYKEERKPAGSVPLPSPVAAVSAQRYTDMSILAPDKLAHDCTALECKMFLVKFKEWLKACYNTDHTFTEMTRFLPIKLDNGWIPRLGDLPTFGNEDKIYEEMEREMRALQPLHLRRIDLIQLIPKKDEKLSQYLQRLRDQGEVADIDKMTPQALVLNSFTDKRIGFEKRRKDILCEKILSQEFDSTIKYCIL